MIAGIYSGCDYHIDYRFNPYKKNLKILDSYKINDIKIMRSFLFDHIGYVRAINRSVDSCINEWVAHNRLYKMGLYKDHCTDTDLSKNESKFRRFCYYILSRYEVIKCCLFQ